MVFISKRNRRREREVQQALNNRLELVKEGFTRRDVMKMGLMTSAGVLDREGWIDARSVERPQRQQLLWQQLQCRVQPTAGASLH